MLEIFIALLLIAFLALFVALSFPLKADDLQRREKSENQLQHTD